MPKNKPPAPGKYIDPLVDFAFKKIFGSEPNKDLLISFLNEVFRGKKHVVDLTYNQNEHHGDTRYEGSAIFDLLCTGINGERFLIEVQRARQGYFKERALFYISRLIGEQAPKGDRNAWAYDISEVYFIALLEDFTVVDSPSQNYIHDIYLCNTETGEIFYDKLGLTFIELSKFVKDGDELQTDLDWWLYILKNISRMDRMPLYLKKPIFEKLFNIAEYTNLTKEDKTMYDKSLKYKWDNQNVLEYAVDEATKRATEKAETKAFEEKREIVREMKKAGVPIAQISLFTKLSIEEIERL